MKTKSQKQDKINIITLGCSKNIVDSEQISTQLKHNNYQVVHDASIQDANIIIVNTCGFIDLAKEESIQTILHYANEKSAGRLDRLFVTGCLSHRYKEELRKEIPEVDDWFGTMDLPALLARFNADYRHELIGERLSSTPSHYAYLKISEGCNRTCSFCAIPLMRGQHRSRKIEELLYEARFLASQGVKELILIAQELTYYGLDIYKKRALGDLLDALNEVDGIEWIRLHYAYPSKFPVDVLDAIERNEKVCKYLDLPLQHASNRILTAMKRQTSREEQSALIQMARERVPGIAIRTTMLVGFPGETEEDFEDLCSFIQEMRFERLGVFQYSHEEGTTAYNLSDEVPPPIKQERADKLMEIQQGISREINEQKIGKTFKVLIDRKQSDQYIGRTEFDSPEVDNEVWISAQNNYLRIGDFAKILIYDATEYDLFGHSVV